MICNTGGVVSLYNNRLMLFRGITALFRIMAKPINTPDAQNAVDTYSNHFA